MYEKVISLIKEMVNKGATEEELATVTAFFMMVNNFDCDKYFELKDKVDILSNKYELKEVMEYADR